MIQIFTCLTGNSAPYAERLKREMIDKAADHKQLMFTAIKDDFFDDECSWDVRKKIPRRYPNGSANHGQMLNTIVKYIHHQTSIVIVVDVDIAVLTNNWDKAVSTILNYYDCIITPKFSGASGPFFCVFPAWLYKVIKPNWMPGTKQNGYITETSRMDTGWRLTREFGQYDPLWLMYHDMRRDGSCLEYFYTSPWLEISHMGGSHKYDFDSNKTQNWIKAIQKHGRTR